MYLIVLSILFHLTLLCTTSLQYQAIRIVLWSLGSMIRKKAYEPVDLSTVSHICTICQWISKEVKNGKCPHSIYSHILSFICITWCFIFELISKHLCMLPFLLTLTAHVWQNWEWVFFSCYCHEIYRVAVGLKNYNYTWKITFFVNMWSLGQFLEKSVFSEFFFTHITHIIVNNYPPGSKFHFYQINF